MLHKTEIVNGVRIYYREAGTPGAPKLLLLHGFPASSHQYRNLISSLSDTFHIIAPDYPGFGNSEMPDPSTYAYTFDSAATSIEGLLSALDFTRFGLYVQDYGGPVGFRIVEKHPEWLEWLIIQNTNAYQIGFTDLWDGLRNAYWKDRSEANEKAIGAFLEPDTIKTIYLHGHKVPEAISPDNWQMDNHFLEREGARQVQLDFFYDYRTNVELYPKWQAFLRDHRPRTIIFWGMGDIFFTPAGGREYLKDLPDAEFHPLDSGHFALEDNLDFIAGKMRDFHGR
jgi:pimeloyl-ACP methyl ester carboxylesterase